MLIIVFLGALLRPVNDNWSSLSFKGWALHNESIIGQLQHKGIGPNDKWFSESFYAENSGTVDSLYVERNKTFLSVTGLNADGKSQSKSYRYIADKHSLQVKKGDQVKAGQVLYTGEVTNRVFYIDMARLLLLSVFVFICALVYIAYHKRKREGLKV